MKSRRNVEGASEMEGPSCTRKEQIKMGNLRRKSKNRRSWRRRWQKKKLTSGSPVERFVWIRILPIRMSLHTSHTACSMVSPALNIDTPQILLLADRFPWYITPCGVSTTCSCKNSNLLLTIRTATQGVFHPHYNWHKFWWLTIKILCTLTLRRLMSYIYGAPILDVSRSHTTTQHSR